MNAPTEAAPILVTGAAGGEQGSTGRHVVNLLRQRGLPVRAMVHQLDARCQQLTDWGAEVVVGDFLDIQSIRAAMRGACCAYFTYPVQAGLLEASTIFAVAARDAGLEAVVEVGHLNNRENSPSPRTREHWLSERIFDGLGPGAIHLRCSVFFSNLRVFATEMIPGKGPLRLLSLLTGKSRLFLPGNTGDVPIPFVAGEDVARVAAEILADPLAHGGKTYLVAGPLCTLREAARTFARVLERKVEYQPISAARFRSILARKVPGNALLIDHLTVLWSEILGQRDGKELARIAEAVGGVEHLAHPLRSLTGREPLSLEEDIRTHRALFS